MKRKGRKAFWHNIKFKYKLTIINENTLEEVVGIHVSKLNGLSVLLAASTVIFLIAASIIAFTPLRNYLPGYMNSELRTQVVTNALRADSLEEALARQNHYIMNIRDILMERTAEEDAFRKKYEERERYNLTAVNDAHSAIGLNFRRPTRGVMATNFNPEEKHFGVDLTASPNESIVAALDGTVILATYTADAGYVVQIQHTQNFVTVYKHCGSLMKTEGDKVKGGEVIALVGKSGNEKDTPHLHFEVWHKGNPVNPAKYVVF